MASPFTYPPPASTRPFTYPPVSPPNDPDGPTSPTSLDSITHSGMSVFTIVVLLVCISVALYLTVGVVFRVVTGRASRVPEACPHHEVMKSGWNGCCGSHDSV
eukprot:PhF_6_TR42300/c0_g2_i1/m.63873